MSYGPAFPEVLRTTFVQLDRVLKGARPAELPVSQPTRFELVINLKTARAHGWTMSQAVLTRADEVLN